MQHSLHTLITSDNATGSNSRLFVIKDSTKDFMQSACYELTHWQTGKARMIRHLPTNPLAAAQAAINLSGSQNS